jgi:hypothetical protein
VFRGSVFLFAPSHFRHKTVLGTPCWRLRVFFAHPSTTRKTSARWFEGVIDGVGDRPGRAVTPAFAPTRCRLASDSTSPGPGTQWVGLWWRLINPPGWLASGPPGTGGPSTSAPRYRAGLGRAVYVARGYRRAASIGRLRGQPARPLQGGPFTLMIEFGGPLSIWLGNVLRRSKDPSLRRATSHPSKDNSFDGIPRSMNQTSKDNSFEGDPSVNYRPNFGRPGIGRAPRVSRVELIHYVDDRIHEYWTRWTCADDVSKPLLPRSRSAMKFSGEARSLRLSGVWRDRQPLGWPRRSRSSGAAGSTPPSRRWEFLPYLQSLCAGNLGPLKKPDGG